MAKAIVRVGDIHAWPAEIFGKGRFRCSGEALSFVSWAPDAAINGRAYVARGFVVAPWLQPGIEIIENRTTTGAEGF